MRRRSRASATPISRRCARSAACDEGGRTLSILSKTAPFESRLIWERRGLHEQPELAGHTEETEGLLRAVLQEHGWEAHDSSGYVTGLPGRHAHGPLLLLCAATEAQPVQEAAEHLAGAKPCVSRVKGVMHARGHDADMAMLLCAARVLGEEAPDAPVAFAFGPGLSETEASRLADRLGAELCLLSRVSPEVPSGGFRVRAFGEECRGTGASAFVRQVLARELGAMLPEEQEDMPTRCAVLVTGMANEARGCGAPLGSPRFEIDEDALAEGACAWAAVALAWAENAGR